MKAENRWASVTFDVLTCPALAARQLCLRLLGQSWRVVSEWQRPGHGAWGRWQRGPWAFWGLVGRFCACLQGTHPLVLLVSIGAGHGATWKCLRFCGDGAPTLHVTRLVSLSAWTRVSSILAGPQGGALPPAEWCLCSALGDLPLMVACWVDRLFLRGSAFKSSVQFLYFFQQ